MVRAAALHRHTIEAVVFTAAVVAAAAATVCAHSQRIRFFFFVVVRNAFEINLFTLCSVKCACADCKSAEQTERERERAFVE